MTADQSSEHEGSVRRRIESQQESTLSQHARKPSETEGRIEEESADTLRTCYQLDRDRILHSRPFRRLKFKTQVFIEPVNDDTRTRLTHTLEVMQIARSAARALSLNEDLTEAIALGHDIGHTPFAHTGETMLDEIASEGFHHSNQSLRVVDRLARQGKRLNLTREVRDGIVKHSKSKKSMFESQTGTSPMTLEGKLVRICDSVAYVNHDIDDAIQADVLQPDDLPQQPVEILGEHGGDRIDRTVRDMVETSGDGEVRLSETVRDANDQLRTYMFEEVYRDLSQQPIYREARRVIRELYAYLSKNPEVMYDTSPFLEGISSSDPVIDFFSLQSDLSTIQLYRTHIADELEYLPDYSTQSDPS
ncbi:MAG: deoxyguanosinetriphosphate triphosphohydrolase [bacterium]